MERPVLKTDYRALRSGAPTAQCDATADEAGAGTEQEQKLTARERELTAFLHTRRLQTREVVLKDTLELSVLLVDRVVADEVEGGADLRRRPRAIDVPSCASSMIASIVDCETASATLAKIMVRRSASAMAPSNLAFMCSPPLTIVTPESSWTSVWNGLYHVRWY